MAVAHRASAQPATTDLTTSGTIVIPASVQADDVLFVLTCNRNSNDDGTLTDDDTGGNTWAQVGQAVAGVTGKCIFWWKRATSGTASKTVTYAGATNSCSLVLSAFSGALASGTPYEGATVEYNAPGDETNAGFTPSVSGTFVCLGVINADNDIPVTTQACTDPGALAALQEHLNTGGTDCSTSIAGAIKNNTNATGNFTWAQADDDTVSMAWAILPAAAAAPVKAYVADRLRKSIFMRSKFLRVG